MANWFTKLFGGGGGDTKQVAPASYFPSQDPRYQRAQKELEDLLSRRGYFNENEMGYTPEMISSTSAPYATARRENFKNYEVPLISAQASARGLGRSLIPVNRIALSGQEAERDIQNKIADLVTQSEQLKGSQKAINAQVYQNAIQGEAGLADKEIASQQTARNQNAAVTNANRAADVATTQAATLFVAQMISPFLSDGLKTTTTPTGQSGGGNSSMVNVSKNLDTQSLMQVLKLFMAGA